MLWHFDNDCVAGWRSGSRACATFRVRRTTCHYCLHSGVSMSWWHGETTILIICSAQQRIQLKKLVTMLLGDDLGRDILWHVCATRRGHPSWGSVCSTLLWLRSSDLGWLSSRHSHVGSFSTFCHRSFVHSRFSHKKVSLNPICTSIFL